MDELGKYDEAVVRALGYLARQPEAPPGVAFSDWGTHIRYLPLVASLYVVFMVGSAKRRYALLKKIKGMTMPGRSRYEEPLQVAYSLLFVRRPDQIYQTQHPSHPQNRWCDAVGAYIELMLRRRLHIDDPLWDSRAAFFTGEFLLGLMPLDVIDSKRKDPAIDYPAPGIYLYFMEAVPIITRFLADEAVALSKLFQRQLKDVLRDFDGAAHTMISPMCFAHGFVRGAVSAAYPQSEQKVA